MTGSVPPVSESGTAAMMSLGSYSAVMRRSEQAGRRRLLFTLISIALVALVGLAAVYTAVTPSDRGAGPRGAAVLSTSSSPGPTEAPEAEPTTAVRARADEADADIRPVEGLKATPTPAEPAASEAETAETVKTAETGQQQRATELVEPKAAAGDEQAGSVGSDGTGGVDPAREPDAGVVRRDGWVCDGEVRVDDPRGRSWSVNRASFQPGRGFERVVLQMVRATSGGSASLTAESFPTSRVQRFVPGVRQPSGGRTTVAVHLEDGFRNNLGIRGYRPSGLVDIKEFSVFGSRGGSARVLVTSATRDACFRVRVPAWNGSPNARNAQVIIDIKS